MSFVFYQRHRRRVLLSLLALILFSLALTSYFARQRHTVEKVPAPRGYDLRRFFGDEALPEGKKEEDLHRYPGQTEKLRYLEPSVVIRADYPTGIDPYLDRQISLSVQNAVAAFRYRHSEDDARSEGDKASLAIRYQWGTVSDRLVSVLLSFEEKDSLRREQSRLRYESYQYDLYYRRFVGLDELFKDPSLAKLAEHCEKAVNQQISGTRIHIEKPKTMLKNILLDRYSLEVYLDPDRLPMNGDQINPARLSYRSLGEELNFRISDQNLFLFDPVVDPLESRAQPVFFRMPHPFAAHAANPEGKIKYIALSFNMAPTKDVTKETLKILTENHARASFFVHGETNGGEQEMMREILRQGSELGNLGNSMADLTTLGMDQMRAEFTACDERIKAAVGSVPSICRSLYGVVDDRLEQSTNGKALVLWDVDAGDWQDNTNTSLVAATVMKNVKAGSVVLMQNTEEFSNLALKELLPALINEGYHVVPVSELYQIYHGKLESGIVHHAVFEDDPDLKKELLVESRIASGMNESDARTEETKETTTKAINMG